MSTIDPAALELPPTQPIDMTALLEAVREGHPEPH
jgi:hypothetical protein